MTTTTYNKKFPFHAHILMGEMNTHFVLNFENDIVYILWLISMYVSIAS